MMKIGIVTPYDLTNYGNRLQNYALYYVLKTKFHCEAKTLVPYEMKPYDDRNYIAWLKKQIIRKACIFPEFAEKRFGTTITRWAAFLNWDRKIPTNVYYQHKKLPVNIKGEFDYFFCGSDQVWNPTPDYINDLYLLKNIKSHEKYAIAASFGISELPFQMCESIKKELLKFKKISTREKTGVEIINQITSRTVIELLIDPTLAIRAEQWIKLERKPCNYTSQKYILNYFLGEMSKERKEKIERLAKENNYKIINLLDNNDDYYISGPQEFLFLERHAELICTDSYHSCVFAIIFHRPFVVFDRDQNITSMSSRIENLLEIFELKNRKFNKDFLDDVFVADYINADTILEKERKKMYRYISECL